MVSHTVKLVVIGWYDDGPDEQRSFGCDHFYGWLEHHFFVIIFGRPSLFGAYTHYDAQ